MINRFLFFSLLIILGCNSKQNPHAESVIDSVSVADSVSSISSIEKINVLDKAKVENVNDTSLVYVITKPGVVNFEPDTARMGEEKKMPDDDWDTVIDDWMFYNSETTQALERNRIDIIIPGDNRRYLNFKKANGEEYMIDKKKVDGFYAFVLFNGVDDPVLLDMTNAEAAVKDVFRK